MRLASCVDEHFPGSIAHAFSQRGIYSQQADGSREIIRIA